jgi:hypothetical protein
VYVHRRANVQSFMWQCWYVREQSSCIVDELARTRYTLIRATFLTATMASPNQTSDLKFAASRLNHGTHNIVDLVTTVHEQNHIPSVMHTQMSRPGPNVGSYDGPLFSDKLKIYFNC